MKPNHPRVRQALLAIGIFEFCLIAWSMLAVFWPPMDHLTTHMPHWFRSRVATDALSRLPVYEGNTPSLNRVIRLDPTNGDAWRHLCEAYSDKSITPAQRISYCQTAVSLKDTAWAERALGDNQLQNDNYCAAYQAYHRGTTTAMNKIQIEFIYSQEGDAAMLCGDMPAAKSAFEKGVQSNATNPDESRWSHAGLSVYYDREGQPDKAHEECLAFDPTFKDSCKCDFVDNHSISCSGSSSTKATP